MIRAPLSVLFVSVGIAAQTVTFAEGTPASATILTVPENNPNAAPTIVLQDVELLPLEITGRVLGQDGDPTKSRLLDRNGIARVELPGGGRLLRYRRGGGAAWGFLHVAADGVPRVAVELPGPAGLDPFADRIGVAPDGAHAAVALLAGGLYVLRLDGGVFASTGTPARLVAAGSVVEEKSVMVGSQVVWFQNNLLQQFRCGLADGSAPVDVSPPGTMNARLEDQVAMAADGSRIVFLYGPQQQQQLWTATLSGTAVLLPPPPSKYEDPGYLPEGAGEPALLLNDDGSRLFFIDADVRDELYLLDVQGSLPTLQITADPIFQPYIGVHVLPRFAADRLMVAIGDPNQMDWFRAALSPSGGTVGNLTATGSALQPYPAGTLDPITAARAGGDWLVAEQAPAAVTLRRVDAASGTQFVMHPDLVAPPRTGSSFSGAADLTMSSLVGDRLYAAGGALPLFQIPPGLVIAPPATGPLYSTVWVELANSGGFGVSAFYLPDGSFATGPFEAGVEQLCATAAGGVVVVGNPVRYLAIGVYVVVNRPAVPWRRCLSGVGV